MACSREASLRIEPLLLALPDAPLTIRRPSGRPAITTTYQDLIADHERIEQAAGHVLLALREEDVDHDNISYRLLGLSSLVSEHLSIEATMLEDLRGKALASPWQRALEDGLPALELLKADWSAFLGEWNGEAIVADLAQFRAEAETILPRLRERVQRETEALYATALQSGVIALR